VGCAWLVNSPGTAFVFALVSSVGLVSSSVATCAFFWRRRALEVALCFFGFWLLWFWGLSALSNVM
jgi:hypothetical protein